MVQSHTMNLKRQCKCFNWWLSLNLFDVLQFGFGFFLSDLFLWSFKCFDVDKSGALTFVELREAFDIILKINLSEEEFETAAAEMDKDSDGSVRFPKFKKYFVSGFVCVEPMCFCRFIVY